MADSASAGLSSIESLLREVTSEALDVSMSETSSVSSGTECEGSSIADSSTELFSVKTGSREPSAGSAISGLENSSIAFPVTGSAGWVEITGSVSSESSELSAGSTDSTASVSLLSSWLQNCQFSGGRIPLGIRFPAWFWAPSARFLRPVRRRVKDESHEHFPQKIIKESEGVIRRLR